MSDIPRFTWGADGVTPAMLEAYGRDGVLVIDGFKSAEDCDRLIERADVLVDGFDPEQERTVFSTTSRAHAAADYFAGSGDKIRFFLEEEALDADGRLTRPKHQAINKIGHAMHDLDPVFDAFSHDPRLDELARALGQAQPKLLQSMYIWKPPMIGGEVVCHQDSTFLTTDPLSVVGFWFALEDATVDNGCMWGIPGGHLGPLRNRFHYDDAGRLVTEKLDDTPFEEDRKVCLEAPKGTLIVLHGSFPHLSGPNRSPKSRRAYTLHVIDGACTYLPDNWLKRGADMPLRGFV